MSTGSDISNQSSSTRPTAKRSPSILVTDARSNYVRGTRAPFAGQNYKKQQQHVDGPPSSSLLHRKSSSRSNKYANISVDKLLSNSSDIPSGQSRTPAQLLGRVSPFRGSSTLSERLSPPLSNISGLDHVGRSTGRRNIRSIPQLLSSLPSRTSKTSHKLVLIPEQQRLLSPTHPPQAQPISDIASPPPPEYQHQIQRSRAEIMPKEARAHEFSRMTAYFICQQFDLKAVSNFLKEHHEVKPRIYDEALYAAYALPLLPGSDGYRIKNNNSSKLLVNKRNMEKMINKSEQTDHLYEYYSGFETPEDANNYSMDPELEPDNSGPFDPSEPQFFAPEMENANNQDEEVQDGSKKVSERDQTSINNNNGHDSDNVSTKTSTSTKNNELSIFAQAELSKHHAEMFVFSYGIVVFWNFSEVHEKNILADLSFAPQDENPLLINPIADRDIETEEFHFEYDNQIHRPRIYNDMITLRSGDHLIKLTMSHAIAQLTKLCLFESRMINVLQLISKLPKKLALTGQLGLKRQQLLKKSGKLFKLRVDVNLSSSILDTPEFFWSFEPALHPLYNAIREYLEIDQRVQVLNDRCKVFLEFLDLISDSMNERNTSRVTWLIIIFIFLTLTVSLFEFIIQVI